MISSKFILMRAFLLPFIFPLLQFQHAGDYLVNIKLIAAERREIRLQVEVRNLSNTSAMVLKNRTRDYKSNTRAFSGNYIIEIEKQLGNEYFLYEVKSNPIPTHEVSEYIVLQKGETLTDTIPIYDSRYPDDMSQHFLPGRYRVRISFNVNGGSAQLNNSNWIEFEV